MIRVIGTDTKYIKQAICRQCASIIEYTENEVKSYKSSDYGGGSDIHRFVSCPTCNNRVTVR